MTFQYLQTGTKPTGIGVRCFRVINTAVVKLKTGISAAVNPVVVFTVNKVRETVGDDIGDGMFPSANAYKLIGEE